MFDYRFNFESHIPEKIRLCTCNSSEVVDPDLGNIKLLEQSDFKYS